MYQALRRVIVNKTNEALISQLSTSVTKNGVCQTPENKKREKNKAFLRRYEKGEAGKVGTKGESSLLRDIVPLFIPWVVETRKAREGTYKQLKTQGHLYLALSKQTSSVLPLRKCTLAWPTTFSNRKPLT